MQNQSPRGVSPLAQSIARLLGLVFLWACYDGAALLFHWPVFIPSWLCGLFGNVCR